MAYYLQMDGVDDRITVSTSVTYNKLEITAKIYTPPDANLRYLFDSTTRSTGGYIRYGSSLQSNMNPTGFVLDQKTTVIGTLATAATMSLFFFSNSAYYLRADVYSIKMYDGASLVAHYDMTLGNVQDQSGNGRHATLTGGTWVDEGGGGTTHTGSATLQGVATQTANATHIPAAILGSAFLQGVATVGAAGTVTNNVQTSSASLVGIGQLNATAGLVRTLGASLQGVSTLSALAAGMNVLASASIVGAGSVKGSALSGRENLKKIKLYGERTTTIRLQGARTNKVTLQGSRQTLVKLQGGMPVAKNEQNFTMTAGETVDIEIISMDTHTGTATNLTGGSVRWVLKQSVNSPVIANKTASLTNPVGGICTVRVNNSDTFALKAGRYYHEAQMTDALGSISVLTRGWVHLEDNGMG